MTRIAYKPAVSYREMARVYKACFPQEPFGKVQYADLMERHYWLATADGVAVAFASGRKIAGRFHLNKLGVVPTHRRRGIARALLSALIAKARQEKASFVTLRVQTDNAPAIRLYQAVGFHATARQSRFRVPLRGLALVAQPATQLAARLTNEALVSGGQTRIHRIDFIEGIHIVGSCVYNPDYPGCSEYHLDKPEAHFTDSLLCLAPYTEGAVSIALIASDRPLAAACQESGFALEYELYTMDKKL